MFCNPPNWQAIKTFPRQRLLLQSIWFVSEREANANAEKLNIRIQTLTAMAITVLISDKKRKKIKTAFPSAAISHIELCSSVYPGNDNIIF